MSKKVYKAKRAQIESARKISKTLNDHGFKAEVDPTGFGRFLFGFLVPDEDGISIQLQMAVSTPFDAISDITEILLDTDNWFIAQQPIYLAKRAGKTKLFSCCEAYLEYAKDLSEKNTTHKH